MADELKFTAGDWAVRDMPGEDGNTCFYAIEAGDRIVASTWPADEEVANARLIAVAPQMWEALRGLLNRYDPENPGSAFEPDAGCIECTVGTVPNDRNTGLCPHHKARAAIAATQA